MTGPWGMGPLMPNSVTTLVGNYDDLIEEFGGIFFVKPLAIMPTYSAWETVSEAAANDIARESQRGGVYFDAWLAESGNDISDYDDLLVAFAPALKVIFEVFPITSVPSYSAWESRDDAYDDNIAIESQRGRIYFRAWRNESGFLGDYEDIMDDSELGTIFKIEAEIT